MCSLLPTYLDKYTGDIFLLWGLIISLSIMDALGLMCVCVENEVSCHPTSALHSEGSQLLTVKQSHPVQVLFCILRSNLEPCPAWSPQCYHVRVRKKKEQSKRTSLRQQSSALWCPGAWGSDSHQSGLKSTAQISEMSSEIRFICWRRHRNMLKSHPIIAGDEDCRGRGAAGST